MKGIEPTPARQLAVLRLLGRLFAENVPDAEIAEILALNFDESEVLEAVRAFRSAVRKGCQHDPPGSDRR